MRLAAESRRQITYKERRACASNRWSTKYLGYPNSHEKVVTHKPGHKSSFGLNSTSKSLLQSIFLQHRPYKYLTSSRTGQSRSCPPQACALDRKPTCKRYWRPNLRFSSFFNFVSSMQEPAIICGTMFSNSDDLEVFPEPRLEWLGHLYVSCEWACPPELNR